MAIRVKRLPEYGVTVVIWSGRLTLEEVRRHLSTLDAASPGRWLNYWDPSVDVSGLGIAKIPEVKRLLAARLKEVYGDKQLISAVVRAPGTHELFPEFWPGYASADQAYPAKVKAFLSLEAACEWLNLPDDGRRAVIDAVEGSQGEGRGSETGAPGRAGV
jgi:hypothetical protein